MKLKTKMIIGAIIIAVILLPSIPNITGSAVIANGEYDDFAKCLTDNGVKMYGAYWCPHCQNQKEMFGASFNHINYIECSLPNRAGQTLECQQEGIKGYPTWEFSDGSRVSRELTLTELSSRSSCEL